MNADEFGVDARERASISTAWVGMVSFATRTGRRGASLGFDPCCCGERLVLRLGGGCGWAGKKAGRARRVNSVLVLDVVSTADSNIN